MRQSRRWELEGERDSEGNALIACIFPGRVGTHTRVIMPQDRWGEAIAVVIEVQCLVETLLRVAERFCQRTTLSHPKNKDTKPVHNVHASDRLLDKIYNK